MLQTLAIATAAFAPAPVSIPYVRRTASDTFRRSDVTPQRHIAPHANFALENIALPSTPAGMVVTSVIAIFPVLWLSAPIIAVTDMRKAGFIQNGPKFERMKTEPPKVRGVRLTQEAQAVANSFRVEYPAKDVELLWGALLKCYGSPDLALQAARNNPQILNPSYSFCNTMLASKQSLVGLMSEAEALEVMRLNPAVLQCGPSLSLLGAGEIKSFAKLRSVGNALVPAEARGAVVGSFLALVIFVIATQGSDDPQVLATAALLKPAFGLVLGSSFLFTAYAAAKSS